MYALERDVSLRALTGFERSAGVEGRRAKSQRASAASVDELDDGVAVVLEVGGQDGVGARVAVVGDKGTEVVGNLGGLSIGHAGRALAWLITLDGGGSEGRSGEKADGEGETHLVWFGGWRLAREEVLDGMRCVVAEEEVQLVL